MRIFTQNPVKEKYKNPHRYRLVDLDRKIKKKDLKESEDLKILSRQRIHFNDLCTLKTPIGLRISL